MQIKKSMHYIKQKQKNKQNHAVKNLMKHQEVCKRVGEAYKEVEMKWFKNKCTAVRAITEKKTKMYCN